MSRSTFGSIDKRAHNTYRVRWTDSEGKKHSKTVHGPRFVAEDALAEIRVGLVADGSAPTYANYWSESVRPSMDTLAKNTVHGYEKSWEKLSGHIGGDTLDSTDWRRVQDVLDSYTTQSSQRKAYVLWRKIMNMAVRDRIIKSNPVDRYIRLMPHKKREKTLLLADEIPSWMERVRGIKYEPVLLFEIGGGLRPEEANALRWDDVSMWEYRGQRYVTASITKTVTMVDNKAVEQDMTKNAFSMRTVVVGEPFASRIEELSTGKSGPLCAGTGGRPTSPLTVTHNWTQWCKRNGVKYVSQKDMRSSYATNMGEAMAPDSVVSRAMGHAGESTKERNYQQSTMRGLARIADMYADLVEEYSAECPSCVQTE